MPIDLAEKRCGERDDEFLARLFVEGNSDYQLEVIDGRKRGDNLVDYGVYRGVEQVGVLEVGRNTSQEATRNHKEHGKHGSVSAECPELRSSWLLTCKHDARFNGLHVRALPLLLELERLEISDVSGTGRYRWREVPAVKALAELGVDDAEVIEVSWPVPKIACTYTRGDEVPAGVNAPVDELERWFGQDGKDQRGIRTKLATELPETHLFVWVDWRGPVGSYDALGGDELPTRPPVLEGVTHVYLVDETAMRGWAWNAADGWRRLTRPELMN